MVGRMAFAIALPGFNDRGRSVTHIFLLMDHFLYRFTTFSEKNENLSIRTLNFLQNAPSNSAFCAFRSSVRRFQMPLPGLSPTEGMVTLRITYATVPLQQNMTKIVCLR